MTQAQNCLTKECSSTEKSREKVLNPWVDITETDDALILTADMPGVAEEDIDITFHDHVLTIEASKTESEHEGLKPYYVEHAAGRYLRRFKVTEEVQRDGIEATLKDGVLRLTLPKAQPVVAQKIKVLTA